MKVSYVSVCYVCMNVRMLCRYVMFVYVYSCVYVIMYALEGYFCIFVHHVCMDVFMLCVVCKFYLFICSTNLCVYVMCMYVHLISIESLDGDPGGR